MAALTASHQSAYAGVRALTAEEMGDVTGQAGLTIDLDAEAREAAQDLSDFQTSSMPLSVTTGNIGLGSVSATTGGLMGLASAQGYEEQIWSVDFVEDSDDASQLLSLWGLMRISRPVSWHLNSLTSVTMGKLSSLWAQGI